MTNEEAIELLYDIQTDAVYNVLSSEKEALEMAIKALEQQPCEDCISREATIEAIYKKYIGGKGAIENAPINDLYAEGLAEAVDAVWDMPSVTTGAGSEDVLAEIKAEIEKHCCITVGSENEPAMTLYDVLQIIDKYKAESEEEE